MSINIFALENLNISECKCCCREQKPKRKNAVYFRESYDLIEIPVKNIYKEDENFIQSTSDSFVLINKNMTTVCFHGDIVSKYMEDLVLGENFSEYLEKKKHKEIKRFLDCLKNKDVPIQGLIKSVESEKRYRMKGNMIKEKNGSVLMYSIVITDDILDENEAYTT